MALLSRPKISNCEQHVSEALRGALDWAPQARAAPLDLEFRRCVRSTHACTCACLLCSTILLSNIPPVEAQARPKGSGECEAGAEAGRRRGRLRRAAGRASGRSRRRRRGGRRRSRRRSRRGSRRGSRSGWSLCCRRHARQIVAAARDRAPRHAQGIGVGVHGHAGVRLVEEQQSRPRRGREVRVAQVSPTHARVGPARVLLRWAVRARALLLDPLVESLQVACQHGARHAAVHVEQPPQRRLRLPHVLAQAEAQGGGAAVAAPEVEHGHRRAGGHLPLHAVARRGEPSALHLLAGVQGVDVGGPHALPGRRVAEVRGRGRLDRELQGGGHALNVGVRVRQ
mmetsp:Transcript_121626/g.326682  ORF Transcript_121626/g.326682 Transcript_121626/m.326682 type:complete len:341 (-) Transcript_121626:891-1913(-)